MRTTRGTARVSVVYGCCVPLSPLLVRATGLHKYVQQRQKKAAKGVFVRPSVRLSRNCSLVRAAGRILLVCVSKETYKHQRQTRDEKLVFYSSSNVGPFLCAGGSDPSVLRLITKHLLCGCCCVLCVHDTHTYMRNQLVFSLCQ